MLIIPSIVIILILPIRNYGIEVFNDFLMVTQLRRIKAGIKPSQSDTRIWAHTNAPYVLPPKLKEYIFMVDLLSVN